jgi:hypothetical protein
MNDQDIFNKLEHIQNDLVHLKEESIKSISELQLKVDTYILRENYGAFMTLRQISHRYKLSKKAAYQLTQADPIISKVWIKTGNKILIPTDKILEWEKQKKIQTC